MDPFSLFLGGVGAFGSFLKGSGASELDDINAEISRSNAALSKMQGDVAREEANYAYDKGSFDQARLRRQVKQVVGGQTAYFGANNLDPTQGSPILLAARTVTAGETDAEIIGVNARLSATQSLSRAASFDANAASSSWQALAYDQKSHNDFLSGLIGAGTSLLTGMKGFKFGSGTNGSLGNVNIGPSGSPFILNFE